MLAIYTRAGWPARIMPASVEDLPMIAQPLGIVFPVQNDLKSDQLKPLVVHSMEMCNKPEGFV